MVLPMKNSSVHLCTFTNEQVHVLVVAMALWASFVVVFDTFSETVELSGADEMSLGSVQ